MRDIPEGLWFSPDTPVSSTNNTDRHDITEISLKVALNTKNYPLIIVLSILRCTTSHYPHWYIQTFPRNLVDTHDIYIVYYLLKSYGGNHRNVYNLRS